MPEIERYSEAVVPGGAGTVQVPEGAGVLDTVPWLVEEYDKATRALDYWAKRKIELSNALRLVAGDHEELTLNGDEVFTYARIEQFRGTDFKKAHPDLYKAYQKDAVIQVLNVDLLRIAKPELFEEFQTRQLRRKV